jgi:hypothetical protein
VIVHYKSDDEAILGVSLAIGDPEPTSTYWAARGTSARKAGVQPSWMEGIRVPIDHWVNVDPPVTLTELRGHEAELMKIRDDLENHHPKAALYFPWIRYGSGSAPMRTFQSYLVKFPQAAVDVIPRLRAAVDAAQGALVGPVAATPEVDLAEAAVEDAAGRGRQRRGQGFVLDQKTRVALETHAMNRAIGYYDRRGWTVGDVHGNKSWDLECTKGGTTLHVEVKGTTTIGEEVLLTPNEVDHARKHKPMALFIVAGISVSRDASGNVTAAGGKVITFDPWTIDAGTLTPIGYKYRTP